MKKLLRDIIVLLLIIVAIAVTLKPTVVKQHSMEPTLHNNDFLFVNKLAYAVQAEPDYGDIVVFKRDDKIRGRILYVKRVIGLEGDRIVIRDGKVYRNGEELTEDYIMDDYTVGMVTEYKIPDNRVFVMGDNRSVSIDSRNSNIGAINEADIIGKAFLRIYPFDNICLL